MSFFCLKLDGLINGGLIGEGVEVGFLVLQPFMVACSSRLGTKRTEQEKNLHFML